MKLISWNVNGLRACVGKGFCEFFSAADADIFAIQETKLQKGQIELGFPGYTSYFNDAEKKGYSGTAVFTRLNPLNVYYDFDALKLFDADVSIPHEFMNEGRVITLEFENFYFINVYVPNSQRELTRLSYRMEWEERFREYILALETNKPVVYCGDLNVAHEEIDLKNPKTNHKNAGFTDDEREKFTKLLSCGYIDSYRRLYPDKTDAYSWWSYMMKARERNIGWRIDYFVVSDKLKDKISDAEILPEVMGSDHCPVVLYLEGLK